MTDPLPDGATADDLRRLVNQAKPIAPAVGEIAEAPAGQTSQWPALIRLDAPQLPDLPAAVLPGFAGDFAHAVAVATETPAALAVGLVLATISAAAARRFRVMVCPGYFEPTNLWVAVALVPGNRKSAVQAAAAAPLLSWERDHADAMAAEITRATSEHRTDEARVKELRTKSARADDAGEARDLARQAADIEAEMKDIPHPPQLWTSDATPEKLGVLLADQGERMAWLSSEGGVFDLLSGRYSGGIPNLDLVLKAHSGDAERVDRGSRPPVYLRHPLLSVGISPQPDVLRGLASKPGFRGRGLLGRFLYLIPPSPLGYRSLDTMPAPQGVIDAYAAGVRVILDTPPALNDEGEEVPHILRLAPAAYAEWMDFARHIEAGMRPGGEFEQATDWAGKAPGAAARLAGVLHVVEHAYGAPAESPIAVETMGRALALMAAIAKHSLYALDLMGADESIAAARRVWGWIAAGRRDRFVLRDAHMALKGTFPHMAGLRVAIDVLAERGYLDIIEPETSGRGRPPSPTVIVRPSLAGGWS